MTEQLPVNDVENLELEVLTPNQAVSRYLEVGPIPPMGTVPVADLAAWGATLGNSFDKLTPEQQYHGGWIQVDKAYSHFIEDPESQEDVRASLGQAREHFGAVREKPGFNRVLGAYALGADKGIGMYEAILDIIDTVPAFELAWNELYAGQRDAARELLKNYERFGNIGDVPALHTVMTALSISMFSKEQIYCLPAPSRATHAATDAKNAWSLQIWDVDNGRLFRGRIAATGPADYLNIPPSLLQNDKYPSSHGQGTLQALQDFHGIPDRSINLVRGSAQARRNQLLMLEKRQNQAERHVIGMRDGLMAYIVEQINTENTTAEVTDTTHPTQAYLAMDPHTHPTQLDKNVLEDLIAQHEVSFAGDELSPADMRALAWMHIEAGVKSASENEVTESLAGAFDRAEDICSDTATLYRQANQLGMETRMMLARAASPVYKAVALHNAGEIDVEAVRKEYMNELVGLGMELLGEFEAMPDYTTPEAVEAYQALQLITACLTITYSSHGANLATMSTPRQGGEGQDYTSGWDITVWPMTQRGVFMPDYYGRIRLDDKDNTATVDENVLTVNGRRIDNDNSFAVLRNIGKRIDGQDIKPQAQKRIDKLADRLTVVAESAEW